MEASEVTIEQIMGCAKDAGASDVHITVGISPKMRVNGKLMVMPFPVLLPVDTKRICDSMMNDKQKEHFEEKGEWDFSYSIPQMGRYRVNAFRQRGSVAMVLRIVGTVVPTPESLSLPPSVIDLYKMKRGLVLVTGPTGSGKSTTLASLVGKINMDLDAHIITLEDPIEYLHRHARSIVNQREIGIDATSYDLALRSALREDPDVILVGEMRDLETISTAITAAETGHLVLSTLHTIGAAATIERIIDVFPPHQQEQIRTQLANVLVSVVSQQLVPTVDKRGRVAAFEVMHATPAIRNLIRENKTHQIATSIQTSRRLGMITMDDALVELYMKGKIDRNEALNFAQDKNTMQTKI
ncbi:MAG: type IV pilus twitching motility protein PilT [Lachnospiraceae bacterium]|nr:type IV pilus twitching motility protein PilT [Lachnospiraceae bacterium]MCI6977064.1 type IV pilus twitching motility protein PilT [Lachnospiraceae bacterium]MDY5640853.1 type IV pilus twitching motility protein PilT [Lachnospiraceae bacterium]